MRGWNAVLVGVFSGAGLVSSAMAEAVEPAHGMMIQVRMPVTSVSSLFNSALGVPQFSIGLSRGRTGLGLGVGVSQAGYDDKYSFADVESESKTNATLYQVAPTVWFEFWHAQDGSASGNIIASAQYGRINFKRTSTYRSPTSSSNYESKGNGNLFGFGLAVGGDHYLSPHFALGVEAGGQGVFASDIKTKGDTGHSSGFSSNLLYGAIRSTIVF